MSATSPQIQQFFIAFFGRPADPLALHFFAQMLEQGAGGLASTELAFADSKEFKGAIDGRDAAGIVDYFYLNLFGRAVDPAGAAFWAGLINKGADLGEIVPLLVAGATGSDLAAYKAKLSAAQAFTAALDTPIETLAYDSVHSKSTAKMYLAYVHDAATLAVVTTPYALNAVAKDIELGLPWSRPHAVQEQVQAAYVAFLGRPADKLGLDFWTSMLDGDPANAKLGLIKANLAGSAEYHSLYQQASGKAIIDSVYEHLFSRHGDSAGIEFWDSMLTAGKIDISNMVTSIASAAQGSDLLVYHGKVAVAQAFTAALDEPEEIMSYDGARANAIVAAYIAKVSDQASIDALRDPDAIQALIDSLMGPPPIPLVGVAHTGAHDTGIHFY